ncbi:BlaI/MecI/CopY family transcriptional regulator [Tetragenococcus muriaticus]|uniref:Uncharacterized protein n=2 Tax=Tetragenococcus muriaticus TaxID=64642 RepID=A0A091C1P1_9ENTE|nr:BlaI/MecI/CopY family transcriptional regulator [Tetragenococcus muriaticus]KFN89957.1 hypothetical protein TMU3MR103_1742 [Tetragenococcus muriaticus 3MR10-3]KFN91965.1 hypothetical protein TMUPMC115_1119 [Tetragenococcus muriaticus PMC-11-5]GMA46682.1 hypothetical protein GCM10025854_09320 [Tetragenococcus muriaticus]
MQITNAEWQVMKIAWTKDVVTSKEVVTFFKRKICLDRINNQNIIGSSSR